MTKLQDDISYLKDLVQKREKYIHFSVLGTALGGILFCIFPFVYKPLTGIFQISTVWLFTLCAGLTFVFVTILSLCEAKKEGREFFPKSIRYVLGNVIVIACTFFSAVIMISHELSYFIFFLANLGYGILIFVSRMFLPKPIIYYGMSLLFYAVVLIFLGEFLTVSDFTWDIILFLIPFGFGHLAVAVTLFLQKKNTKK